MRKFAVTVALVLVWTTCVGFSARQTANPVYFQIDVDGKIYTVDYQTLRGNWWNEAAFRARYADKSLCARARDCRDIRVDLPEVWRVVQAVMRENECKPHNGTVLFAPHEDERFTVVGQKPGFDIDEEALCDEILVALGAGRPCVIRTRTRVVAPRDAGEIIGGIGLRGGYTTYFESNPNREHNIALALSKFDGLVVQNGQSVSFNGVVGARSAARGFREAKIILDGEFVPGIGGGVCQASTTLFNALLLGGVTIDESHNHSLAISYVPLGRDAMVSSGSDLRFTNNTGGNIYFQVGTTDATEARHGTAWVRIYGNRTAVKYKPRAESHEIADADGNVTERRAVTYIDTWRGERLVHTKQIRRSRYNVKHD